MRLTMAISGLEELRRQQVLVAWRSGEQKIRYPWLPYNVFGPAGEVQLCI